MKPGSLSRTKLRTALLTLGLGLTGLAPLSGQTAVPDPIVTRPASTLGPGGWAFGLGFDYAADTVPQPLLGERKGDLLRGPLLRFAYGLGERAEVSAEWPSYQDFDPEAGDGQSSVGDLHLWTRVAFRQKSETGPVLGLRFGFKVPNASEEDGLGTDESDVYGSFLLEAPLRGRDQAAAFLLNLGLGILGDPLESGEQVDVITYGVGLELPFGDGHSFLLEAAGYIDDSSRRESGDTGEARAGFRLAAGPGTLDTALRAGFTDQSPDWGLHLGYSWRFPKAH
jgi:hypothetical protein